MDVIELFKTLLKFRSVTPDDDGMMEFIEEYLKDYEVIKLDTHGVKNRFFYKRFGEGEHLCFGGHVDVVPAGEGWESDPFTPVERDGYIYARGAQDMKSGLCAFLKAAKDTKRFRGVLSLLLTSDEEGDAKYGTIEMLRELKKRNLLPDFAIVAEPTSEERFGDAIKIGRRGSINGVIEKIGIQGHAAYPEKSKNPIHKVAKVLPYMAGVDLDSGDENFAPSKFVITDIRAGMEVTNVTPGKLKMMFNVRNSTKTTKEDVKEFVERYFRDMDYVLTLSESAKPFVTDRDSKVVKLMSEAIFETVDIIPKLSTAGGTSDARFFGEFGVDTVEFGPKNDTIHAPNERVGVDEVKALEEVFKRVIEKF
jgi:succinyl-diaminopimelate desuccinylase